MIVHIPSPIQSYTQRKAKVDVSGHTIAEVLAELDRNYPGLRFRIIDEQDQIRRHIRLYINTKEVSSIQESVRSTDELHIIAALSGG